MCRHGFVVFAILNVVRHELQRRSLISIYIPRKKKNKNHFLLLLAAGEASRSGLDTPQGRSMAVRRKVGGG